MSVRSRRRAREIALRTLYEVEVGKMGPAKVARDNLAEANLPADLQEFAESLINGVLQYGASLDAVLTANLHDYSLDRLAVVDRVILRIAAFELYHLPKVPPAVTLNEAIDIAKKYSTVESGKFVNGVLGQVLKQSPKNNWEPEPTAEEEEPPVLDAEPDEIPAIEDVDVTFEEATKLARVGGWKLRTEDPKV